MCICVICVVLCVCCLYVIGTWVFDRFCVSAISLALQILSKDYVSTYDIKFSLVCTAGSMNSASVYMVIFVRYNQISTIKYKLYVTRFGYNVFR
jgi:hypothetical protein